MPYDLRVRGVAPLGAWLDHEQITVLHLVPGAFREFVATLKPGPNFPALRLLQLGGEAILPPDVELYKRYFDDRCLLRVGLGLTEAGGCPSMILLDKGAEIGGTVPAGYAMPDKELLILDDAGRTLAPGETGEIAVRSRFLAQGYWRRPELTAERFRSDTAGDGMRVYLTGDLGRLAPDGNLEHLGRKDHQIKIRGHRVELGEVESALRDLPGVIECAVAKRSWRGSDHLVGYLVCASNSHLNVSRVSRLLRARLPAQSVPSAYVFLETMPRTPAGKVDRAALPLPGAVRPDLDSRYTAPRNDTERTLCDLWEETLGVAPIGVEDNFFDLGGDSLSAARLFATLDAKFGRELPLPVLLQAPTVEQLAEVLKPEADAASWASVIPLQTRGTRSPLFCVDLRNAGIFLHLARRLGLDQPCYGLHPLGLGGAALRFSIPSLAEHFIGEVRRIQPTGPYYLSGLCAGGVAAFEMAQQLRAQGERVALLLLVDSFFPTFTRLPYAIVRPWSRFRRKWVLPAWQRLRGITPPLVSDEGPAEKADAEHEKHRNKMHAYLHAVRRASRHALMSYRPRPFDGRLVLFLAKDSTVDELHEPRERWRSVARGGVETFEFAGTHTGILAEPRVREVADRLRCLLDLADVKGS